MASCWFEVKRRRRKFSLLGSCHIAPAMPIPSLPFEITERNILLAIADLVEQECNQSTPLAFPLSNAFLLATSLVSSTWRSISQLALLRHGLVSPSGAVGFLRQLEDREFRASVRSVRVWSGRTGEVAAFPELFGAVPSFEQVEIVGPVVLCQGLEHRTSF